MILNFMISGFVSCMKEILEANNITRIGDPSSFIRKQECKSKEDDEFYFDDSFDLLKEELKNGICQEIDGINSTCYAYLSHILDNGDSQNIIFRQNNGQKDYLFLLEADLTNNSYFLYAQNAGALKFFVKNSIYGSDGLIYGFDRRCKTYIDSEFASGHIAFINNFNYLIRGIKLQEFVIKTALKNNNIDDSSTYMPLIKVMESISSPDYMKEMRALYSTYVMEVFSFIEHAAVLILPFWYSLREKLPYWNEFCNGFHPSGFDKYRDFWTCKSNWIDAFVETLCGFKRNDFKSPQGTFRDGIDDETKMTKRLYDRLRADYRNPVHHGFSTEKNKTGLSMEIPSLQKVVFFNMPPLLRELDLVAYQQTKKLFSCFMKVLNHSNPEIFKYISTGWNVPVDCKELASYVLNGNIDEFIKEYDEEIYSKKDLLIDSFTNGYGYNWETITGRKY